MANHLQRLAKSDLFLLNRTSSGLTYKIQFEHLVDDIGKEINNEQHITIDNLSGIKTDVYISDRDISGRPSATAKVGEPGNLGKDDRFWMLQYIPENNTAGTGGGVSGDFVLADGQDFLNRVTGAIELNSLTDVTTKDGNGDYNDVVFGDTILVADRFVQDENGVDTTKPLYVTGQISTQVNNLLEKGDINVSIEHITEINPNVYPPGGNPDLEGKNLYGRLEVTTEYKKGLTGAIKYEFVDGGPDFEGGDDDILVYIENPTQMITNAAAADAGNGTTVALNAGWYVADSLEAGTSAGGGFFDPDSQIADSSLPEADIAAKLLANEVVEANLGVVRVAPRIDSTFVDDDVNGGQKFLSVGTGKPTNIKITSTGILYSEVPDTLTFRGSLDVRGGNRDAATGQWTDPTHYVNEALIGQSGPGDADTPNDTDTEPATGDFYVVYFDNANGFTSQPGDTVALQWNTIAPPGNDDGQVLVCRDGDIVAFGKDYWNIIGNASTDSIRQDLHNVLTEGNTSDNGIVLTAATSTSGAGIMVGTPNQMGVGGTPTLTTADGGEVAAELARFQNIDFDMFAEIPNNVP